MATIFKDDRNRLEYGTYGRIPGSSMQFLGDEETVKAAMEAVANQGKAK